MQIINLQLVRGSLSFGALAATFCFVVSSETVTNICWLVGYAGLGYFDWCNLWHYLLGQLELYWMV